MTIQAEEIQALREKIATLQAEKRSIQAMPRDRQQVEAHVRKTVAHLHDAGTAAVARELQRTAAGLNPSLFNVSGLVAPAATGAAPFSLDLGPLLVALLGKDAVCRALMRSLPALPEDIGKPEDRAARVEAISAELDALETEEEQLIVTAEAFGEDIPRRVDARPEIVLAVVPS